MTNEQIKEKIKFLGKNVSIVNKNLNEYRKDLKIIEKNILELKSKNGNLTRDETLKYLLLKDKRKIYTNVIHEKKIEVKYFSKKISEYEKDLK